jgi:hypothetical protein
VEANVGCEGNLRFDGRVVTENEFIGGDEGVKLGRKVTKQFEK